MIKYVPLGSWAAKDLHALLSCNISFGQRWPHAQGLGHILVQSETECPDPARNELGTALRHDDAVTNFLTTLQFA